MFDSDVALPRVSVSVDLYESRISIRYGVFARGKHPVGFLQGVNIPCLAHPLDDSSNCVASFLKMLATHLARCEGSGILVVVVGDGLRSGVLCGSPHHCFCSLTSSSG